MQIHLHLEFQLQVVRSMNLHLLRQTFLQHVLVDVSANRKRLLGMLHGQVDDAIEETFDDMIQLAYLDHHR